MKSRVVAACAVLVLVPGACADGTPNDGRVDVGGLPTGDPDGLGFDAAVLDRLADEAAGYGSTCFMVARQGQVALARYWDGGGADRPQDVFSVTKSVTSTLVGLAQADGDLALDDPASDHVEAWRGTPSDAVTVRDLLSNVSGRSWSMTSDYDSLLSAADRTAYAVGLEQEEPPGTVWVYNNAAVQTLDAVLRSASGTSPAAFAADRLFDPLGMAHTQLTEDDSGRSTNVFTGMQSTCPDLVRFGTLFAQDGEWDGRQLVPRSWVREAVGASSQEHNAAYGLLWWLNRRGPVRPAVDPDDPDQPPGALEVDQLVPGASEELFAAQGLGGQVVLVDPRTDTVVVRLGPPEDSPDGYQISDAARVITEALTDAGHA